MSLTQNQNNGQQEDKDTFVIGGLELNQSTKEVSVDGKLVKMTPIEFKILNLMMRNPDR